MNQQPSESLVREGCWRLVNQPLATNTYVICSSETSECVLIDPGLCTDYLQQFVQSKNLKVAAILCTHGHFDHIGSVHHFQKLHNSVAYLHGQDQAVSKSSNFLMMACKVPGKITIPTFDTLISEEVLDVHVSGFSAFKYMRIPGHTSGSCAIYYEDLVFTGDSVYADSVGLVSLPGEKPLLLAQSIVKLFSALDPESRVMPGHGRNILFKDLKEKNMALKSFLIEQLGSEVAW